jgi:hypothetical protein
MICLLVAMAWRSGWLDISSTLLWEYRISRYRNIFGVKYAQKHMLLDNDSMPITNKKQRCLFECLKVYLNAEFIESVSTHMKKKIMAKQNMLCEYCNTVYMYTSYECY